MGSLATENSIASVPLSHLAELQNGLMAGAHGKMHAQVESGKDAINSAHCDESEEPGSLSNAATSPDHALPHAAPSSHGYRGGDTQPMDSQVYRDFTESMVKTTTPKKSSPVWLDVEGGNADTYDTNATERTPKTCQEGETGYINLVEGFQPSPLLQSQSQQDRIVDDLLAESPFADTQQFAASARPAGVPETPAMVAGKKHGRNGEILTSATTAPRTTTPGFSQFFPRGPRGDVLSATQLFHQTQAPSSPVPDVPLSDPVVSRPSPNLLHHFSVSSPEIPISSPMATMPNRCTTTLPEPRGSYTSMRESQEQHRQAQSRAAQFRKEYGLERRFGDGDDAEDDDDEDGQDTQQRRFERKRIKRVMSDQAMRQLANIRAPSRPGSRSKVSTAPLTIDLVTSPFSGERDGGPRADLEHQRNGSQHEDQEDVVDEADDHDDDGDDVFVEEEVDHGQREVDDDDDVYDELGQTVLRSQGFSPEDEDSEVEELGSNVENSEYGDGHSQGDEDDTTTRDELAAIGPSNEEDSRDLLVPRTTQHTAVADSQPERQAAAREFAMSPQYVRHSSVPSVIPGSQYAGRTSQDQTQHSSKNRTFDASQRALPEAGDDARVPSSPPLPVTANDLPGADEHDESATGRNRLNKHSHTVPHDSSIDEVPESDIVGPYGSGETPSVPHVEESKSHSVPLFSTAQTHVSSNEQSRPDYLTAPNPVSPLKKFASQQSKVSSQSPRRAAGVRHFSEIAGSFSASQTAGESQLDIDGIIGGLITSQDQQHIETISSPPPEQRRPAKRRALMRASAPQNSSKKVEGDDNMPPENVVASAGSRPKALRNSPSKANEMPPSTPAKNTRGRAATPESVKTRERAGANAASQVLAKRAKSVEKGTKTKTVGTKASARGASKKTKKKSVAAESLSEKVVDESTGEVVSGAIVDAEAVQNDADTTMGEAGAAENPTEEISNVSVEKQSLARIFALFRGPGFNKFYPATWLGSSADGANHRVHFDDGTIGPVEPHLVRRLDLQLDDVVKIDLDHMRTKTWLIKGPGAVASEANRNTDMHGHRTVKVQMKSSRASLPGGIPQGEGELVEVDVERIYLPPSLWRAFDSRHFTPPSGPSSNVSRAVTPSTGLLQVDADTPGSRTRRPAALTTSTGERGIFANMAFAISYGGNESEKAEVTRLIKRNGGHILEHGFDELFDLPDFDDDDASGTKTPTELDRSAAAEYQGLHLRPEYQGLGFVALIADRHSRRAKYIQALALGLPTLSGKWIIDSQLAAQNTNVSTTAPLQWSKYLLPAGESSYLSGAVRSRTIVPYSARDAALCATISTRPLLLPAGAGVLIVVSRKSKVAWQRRKAYAFLTLALGARSVRRVADLEEAKRVLSVAPAVKLDAKEQNQPQGWKWIYVDGDVTEARNRVFASSTGKKGGNISHLQKTGKKRKASDAGVGSMPGVGGGTLALSAGHGEVKVVNDEFVVQSLILGDLLD